MHIKNQNGAKQTSPDNHIAIPSSTLWVNPYFLMLLSFGFY